MMKKTFLLLMVLSLMSVPALCRAETAIFKISVTVPAIIGYNTPPFDENTSAKNDQHQMKFNTETTTEEVWRGDEKIVLNTVVMEE